MRLQLEVGEHHLRVERAGDAVDRVLQQHARCSRAGRPLEHEIEEQRLAQRGRHLGDEDRVARVHERLRLMRQQRVHRVPHLVRQREHRVERLVVVEQHVRVRAVHRRRVRAAALAGVLEDVDPAAVERRGARSADSRRRAARTESTIQSPDLVVRVPRIVLRRAARTRRTADTSRARARCRRSR